MRSKRLIAGAAAIAFGVAGTAVGTAAPAGRVPTLSWQSCQLAFECASADAPLDYDDPDGERITLGLIRSPAGDPSRRIGTLFVSPGGLAMPMTTGVVFPGIVDALGPRVRQRFDIVGVDPRGGGGSEPLRCTPAPGVPPVRPPQEAYPRPGAHEHKLAYDDYVRTSCAATGGRMLEHLTTADNARDLDLVRAALGEEQLNLYGISYGGFLGQTYASMFPQRVRAIAVDAVLDPVAWAGRAGADVPMSKRAKAGEASEESLTSAFARCDQANVVGCPLTGNALGRWDRVRESLAAEPLALPGGGAIDDQTFEVLTTGVLQIQHIAGIDLLDGFRVLATLTRIIETLRFGPAAPTGELLSQAATLTGQLRTTVDSTGDVADGTEGGRGTQCADTVNPTDPRAWLTAAENYPQAPRFGALNTWSSSWCAGWPGATTDDAYRGPFGGTTATPLLFINNSHDPVTPIAGARRTAALFPGSRLIEVNTWGHSALGKSSTCLTPATTAYLIDRQLPPQDLRCQPDAGLWGSTPVG